MAAGRVIPIKVLRTGAAAAAEDLHVRLERAGFLQMMAIGEPRLSEFVEKYKALGYEVEVVPFVDEASDDRPGGGEAAPAAGTIYVRKQKRPTGEDDRR